MIRPQPEDTDGRVVLVHVTSRPKLPSGRGDMRHRRGGATTFTPFLSSIFSFPRFLFLACLTHSSVPCLCSLCPSWGSVHIEREHLPPHSVATRSLQRGIVIRSARPRRAAGQSVSVLRGWTFSLFAVVLRVLDG